MLTAENIAQDLARMGVRQGDTLYVRTKASAIGRVASPAAKTILTGFLDAVGADGTLIVPAFTNGGIRWSKEKRRFTLDAPTNCGALSTAVLKHPDHHRSAHPTHSFAAIGPLARSIVEDHDSTKTPFHPIRRLVDMDATMLLVGCNEESPGFSTIHLVQSDLGLSQRHWLRFLYEVQIEKDGKIENWHPSEDPGCSLGFDKMYRHYIRRGNFVTGNVGDAYSILVKAKDAYEVERAELSKNPRAVLCDHDDCASCRILRGYNLGAMPVAAVKKVYRMV